jgi:prepilin-type processing-associated H-X9-DG protein
VIEHVSPMGCYGINIGFSDGHARGIYPWAYLSQLLKE